MASEKTLKLRSPSTPTCLHTAKAWSNRDNQVSGDPRDWPKNVIPIPRSERRAAARKNKKTR